MADNGDQCVGRINGWQRTTFYSNLNEARTELDNRERITIAEWWNPEAKARIKHVWAPEEEKPFIVELTDDSISLDEEGQYRFRKDGGNANKQLMRKYP